MSRITLIVEFCIRPGMVDAFEAAAERLREAVQRDEPGTEQYDWWLATDGTRDINIESFVDSDALAYHMANTSSLVTPLVAAADVVRVEVLGELSEAGHAAISAAATGHFTYRGGVDR